MKLNKFKGLNLLRNSFEGSSDTLEVLNNAVISQDNIISKRRGYGTFLSVATSTSLNLMDYKSKLVSIGDNEVQVYNQDGSYNYSSTTTLSGQTFTVTNPRYTQAGGNAYITTDDYVLKLEDTSSSLLKAGVPKAPDLTYTALGSGSSYDALTGIHAPDSQIGYRVLFGRKDVNNNLVLGAPSELTQNNNTLLASSSISLSTYNVTTTYTSHGLNVNDFVTIRNSNGSVPVPDGEYVVTAVPTADTFTIDTSAVLSSAPTGVTSLNFGKRIEPQINFTIPSGVDSTAFIYQIYRTDASISGDVEPDESTLQKIYEANITSSQLSTGYIDYTDTVDDLFKQAYLYTNPNTGEGINEANYPPPQCSDIALFNNHIFYAKPVWNNTLNINLIRSNSTYFSNGDYIDIIQVSGEGSSTSALWQSGTTVRYTLSTAAAFSTGNYVNFTGFVNSANNGKFIVTAVGTSYVDVTNTGRTDNTLDESSVTCTGYKVRRYTAAASSSYNTAAGGDFKLTTSSSSVATNIDLTARDIVKAINRDAGSNIYASYTSSSLSLPGQMYFYGKDSNSEFALQASDSDVGSNFDPTLPTTASDITTVVGIGTSFDNGIAISKINEFEAVPLLSYKLIGSKTASILRILPLKNSLIIFKEDGVFRLSGTTRNDFSITQLDPSVVLKANESPAILNGLIYCLTTQGIVQVSETTVGIISNDISPRINELLSNTSVNSQTFGNAQESNKLYLLSTIAPTESTTTITYCYNVSNGSWSTWDILFKRGVVQSANDTFYVITSSNAVKKERKLQTKLDYCDESTSTVTLNSVSVDGYIVSAISTLSIEVGDVFVFSDTINRITDVSGNILTFKYPVNFTTSDSVTHYKRIITDIVTSPIISSDVSTLKQYSEQTIQFRNINCSSLDLGWVSDAHETQYYTWSEDSDASGWGELDWGSFAWGNGESIVSNYYTTVSQPCRVFLPIEVQVSTWIKPKIQHYQAAETIYLQEIGTVERSISKRNSK